MSNSLKDALSSNVAAIRMALPSAERELAESRARCEQLEDLIRRANVILADSIAQTESTARLPEMSLRAAMELVLREKGGLLSAPEIVRELERRNLYRRRDGKPAGVGQVHSYVYNYPKVFARHHRRIALVNPSSANLA